ncbi:MAG TPA: YgiQ family radical SAM protein, partial [Polyangia bacterium]
MSTGLTKLRRGRFEHPFLPVTAADVRARGWSELDIIIISGDAYVDHPAFGPPLIARFLEGRGFKVGILAQPNWRSVDAFRALGRPRLFFGIAAGNMDSMLNRLTAQKKNRGEDQYSPGGARGMRPDRATIVYANRAREAFGDVPIVLGGIEASLRRIAHYDYWSDTVRRSILLDAKADLLVFGMGERPIWEIARRLRDGEAIAELRDIRGTAVPVSKVQAEALAQNPSQHAADGKVVVLPPFEDVRADKKKYAFASRTLHYETNPYNARPLMQRDRWDLGGVWFNPPALPLETADMDELYDLPFNRAPHPMYGDASVPAFETVKSSLVIMRGCFGGCTFCSITEHEGRVIQNRSADSILRELRAMRRQGEWNGVISDLGGPTANMYQMRCEDEKYESRCRRLSCVHPDICKHLKTDHGPLIDLMKRVREEPGVKHVHIASGVRTDLVVDGTRGNEYLEELTRHHVGGQLSVAPEHVSDDTLRLMKKPPIESYDRFTEQFRCASGAAGKEQYLIPYFISGHPGSTLDDMIAQAQDLKKKGYRPRQVQDFIPTPMSLAATMYYSGIDPLTMKPCYTAKGLREKRMQ